MAALYSIAQLCKPQGHRSVCMADQFLPVLSQSEREAQGAHEVSLVLGFSVC